MSEYLDTGMTFKGRKVLLEGAGRVGGYWVTRCEEVYVEAFIKVMADRLFDPAPAKPPYTPEEIAAYFREVVRIFEDAGIHLPGLPPPAAPAKDECGECRFWDESRGAGAGSCRCNAPSPVNDKLAGGADWPVTEASCWCGEFKRREGAA